MHSGVNTCPGAEYSVSRTYYVYLANVHGGPPWLDRASTKQDSPPRLYVCGLSARLGAHYIVPRYLVIRFHSVPACPSTLHPVLPLAAGARRGRLNTRSIRSSVEGWTLPRVAALWNPRLGRCLSHTNCDSSRQRMARCNVGAYIPVCRASAACAYMDRGAPVDRQGSLAALFVRGAEWLIRVIATAARRDK